MKIIISLFTFFTVITVTIAQTTKSDCDQYRRIIENNIEELNMDEFGRSMIVGKKNEYINQGMSMHFISEPKVPDYIYTSENLNMKMVDIIIAHVDLYHCDVAELNKVESRNIKSPNIQNQYHLKVYPNPTQEFVNIEGDMENLEQILIFNSNGRLVRRIQEETNRIDLTEFDKGTYYLYFLAQGNIQSEKVIRM